MADGRLQAAVVSAPFGLAMAAGACTYRRLLAELATM
jgi:hypothetical protein